MTVPSTTSAAVYTADGTTATFPYTWSIADQEDLLVYSTLTAATEPVLLALTTDYTVTGVGVPTGGTVVLTAGNPASGTRIFICSDPEQVQELLLQQAVATDPADVMAALDLLTRMVQANRRRINQCFQFPLSEALDNFGQTVPLAVERASKYPAFDDDGNLTIVGGSAGGGISVAAGSGIEVDFASNVYTVSLFTAMTASLSGGSNQEIGASIASVNLAWSYNKTPTSQTLTGPNTTPPLLAARSQTVTGPYTTNQSWTIQGFLGTESPSATTNLAFLSKRYWGVSSNTTLTDAQIIGLAGSELATNYVQSRQLTPSAQYLYFAWPSAFGSSPTFTVNGLLNTAWTAVRSNSPFVNASGATVNYDLWRSNNLLSSTFQVAVS